VSSTEVREKLRRGEDVSALVPRTVLAYIRERGLYRG
jgi:nicotinate-nucleotide adenylyltransferase